mgnify:CR=1 FL=1
MSSFAFAILESSPIQKSEKELYQPIHNYFRDMLNKGGNFGPQDEPFYSGEIHHKVTEEQMQEFVQTLTNATHQVADHIVENVSNNWAWKPDIYAYSFYTFEKFFERCSPSPCSLGIRYINAAITSLSSSSKSRRFMSFWAFVTAKSYSLLKEPLFNPEGFWRRKPDIYAYSFYTFEKFFDYTYHMVIGEEYELDFEPDALYECPILNMPLNVERMSICNGQIIFASQRAFV